MSALQNGVKRLKADAECASYKLGPNTTRRLIAILEYMVAEIEQLKEKARDPK